MKRLLFLVTLLAIAFQVYGQEKIKVACVGNSVTYGTRIADREHDSYPAQLQKLLGERYEVRNFGRPCATLNRKGELPYFEVEECRKALDFKADRVIIHLGLNDTDPHNWPNFADDFIADYRALIDSFRTVNPAAQIWICKMTPIFHPHKRFQSGTRDWHGQIQQKIEQIAHTANVGLIDFYEPLHSYPELFPDALHPDPQGAGILARQAYGALTGDFGGLKIPVTYGDHMVLQREQPIVIKGSANAGEEVTVRFNKQKRQMKALPDGTWKVTFPAQQAGGPYTLSIEAESGKHQFSDVWVGEVWLCSGQSNMEYLLRSCTTGKEDIAKADQQDRLHFYNIYGTVPPSHNTWNESTLQKVQQHKFMHFTSWKKCDAKRAANFSAIAYHFGRILADSLQCHVGLICNAVGASSIEAWIDRSTLEHKFPAILYNWTENDFCNERVRKRAKENTALSKHPLQRHPNDPAYLFETGVQPLKDYSIRGVIWCQGEANDHNVEVHEQLFPLFVDSWRQFFQSPELPIYFIQLTSVDKHPSWTLFRDSQRRLAQQMDNVWMTVSSDWGIKGNVHYRNKRPVAQRLAHSALHFTYHKDHIVPSGPEFQQAEYRKGKALLTFAYGEGLHPSKGNEIIGFELAGADGLFYPATAKVTAKGLEISSRQVKDPQAVRYGWQCFTNANLVNGADMPCSTFRDEQYHY